MVFRIITVLLVVLLSYFSLRIKQRTYDDQYELVQGYLGTRTPYRYKYNKNDSTILYKQCKESKIWMIVRHGTRLPSAKDIIGMNTILNKIKQQIIIQHENNAGTLSPDQIQQFLKWKNNYDPLNEKKLTAEGQNEMILLAERVQNRFPNAISKIYLNNNTHQFRYTATERAQQSAKYFTLGLFDKNNADKVEFVPASKVDPILRFYKHCDRWQIEVKKNSSTYLEQKLFGKSKEINDTLQKVSTRLGFNYLLSLDEVSLMFKICGYETSWDEYNESPWCYVLDKEDAQRLEYYYDLKHYWMDGYGYKLTHSLGCLSINTMFDQFSDSNGPKAVFLFAHSGTLLKLLSYLNLYNTDPPLRGDRIQYSRVWRATEIDCFASNLAFVLYRCEDGDRVLTLHQERIIKLPMCEEELCPLEQIKQYYSYSITNCDMTQMCSLK